MWSVAYFHFVFTSMVSKIVCIVYLLKKWDIWVNNDSWDVESPAKGNCSQMELTFCNASNGILNFKSVIKYPRRKNNDLFLSREQDYMIEKDSGVWQLLITLVYSTRLNWILYCSYSKKIQCACWKHGQYFGDEPFLWSCLLTGDNSNTK